MTQEIILKLLKKIRISKTERRDKISGGLMMVHKRKIEATNYFRSLSLIFKNYKSEANMQKGM